MNILLILFYLICNTNAISFYEFKVCGNYCGPKWCNGRWLDEKYCNANVSPEYHNSSGYSCADTCCRYHDICCGQNKSKQINCNKKIIKCINKCKQFSLSCTFYGIGIPTGFISVSMNIINNWCCGTKCQ